MTEFYRDPFTRLRIGGTTIVHRGDLEFEIIRQSPASFMPWCLHAMVEASSPGLHRKMPCAWTEEPDKVVALVRQEGVGGLAWSFRESESGLLAFRMTLTNASPEDWRDTTVSVHTFPEPRLFRGDKTYVEENGAIREIRSLWPRGVNATRGVYPFRGREPFVTERLAAKGFWKIVPCGLTAPFVFRIGGGNEPTPHARWCESLPLVTGLSCERINAVVSNFEWPCLDLFVDYGAIPRGEARSQQGYIGIMQGTAEDFVKTVRGDR